MKQLIDYGFIEHHKILNEEVTANGPKIMRVRGKVQEEDVVNGNNRKYPSPIWKTVCEKFQKAISEKQVLGVADHPKDGQTNLKEVSHVITKMEMVVLLLCH